VNENECAKRKARRRGELRADGAGRGGRLRQPLRASVKGSAWVLGWGSATDAAAGRPWRKKARKSGLNRYDV